MSSSLANTSASSNPGKVPSTPQSGASYSWFGSSQYGVYTHRCDSIATCTSPGAHRTPVQATGLSPFRSAETPLMGRERINANLASFVAEHHQPLPMRQPKRKLNELTGFSSMRSPFVDAATSAPIAGTLYAPLAFLVSPAKRRRLIAPSSTGSPLLEPAYEERAAPSPVRSAAELEAPEQPPFERDSEEEEEIDELDSSTEEEEDELDSSTDGEMADTHPVNQHTLDIHPQPGAQDGGAAGHDEGTLLFPANRAKLVEYFAKGLSLRSLFEKETRANGSVFCKAPLVLISGQWYHCGACDRPFSTGEIYQRHVKSGHLGVKERSSVKKILEDWGESSTVLGKRNKSIRVAAWDPTGQPFPDVGQAVGTTTGKGKGKATSRAGKTNRATSRQ